jgi:threonine aldolase
VTPEERVALRRGCALVFGGPPEPSPGAELVAVGEWCNANGHAQDVYGDGPLVRAFEEKIAGLLGCEAALFVPSGIMAQQIALRIHADETQVPLFGMHATSHLEIHELRAYARVQRLEAVILGPRGRPTLAQDLAACAGRLAAVLVELPAREIGGQLPSWDELAELSSLARSRGMRMHMDGARLWEAREAYAPRTHADICALFDSIYVSFYKGIGAIAGAALAGSASFVAQAREWRKRMGGTLVHLYPYVASAAMRLPDALARMPGRRQSALAIARALAEVEGVRVLPSPPQVSMFHVHFDIDAEVLDRARIALAQRESVWIGGRFAPSEAPGSAVLEINAGDPVPDLPPGRLAGHFRALVALARELA